MEKRILAKCGGKKAKCGRKKALFGSQEAATLAAAGITAAATAAAAVTGAKATKQAADAQANAQRSAAQKQADAITKQSELAKQSQQESQEFIKEQNEENRQLQKDIQIQLQMLAGQQTNNDRLEANKIVVKNGGKTKLNASLKGNYYDNNIPFKVTDGGYVVPVAKTSEGFNLFEIKGNDHEHYHKTSGGKNKTGVGIKFADGNVVEGEGNQNTNQGEYMLQTPNGAYFISKHNIAGFNPAKAVNAGMHPLTAFNIQEQQKYMNGIVDNGKKISSPVKGNKKLAGGIIPTIYNMYNQTGPQFGVDTVGDTAAGVVYSTKHRKLACGGRHKARLGRYDDDILTDSTTNNPNRISFEESLRTNKLPYYAGTLPEVAVTAKRLHAKGRVVNNDDILKQVSDEFKPYKVRARMNDDTISLKDSNAAPTNNVQYYAGTLPEVAVTAKRLHAKGRVVNNDDILKQVSDEFKPYKVRARMNDDTISLKDSNAAPTNNVQYYAGTLPEVAVTAKRLPAKGRVANNDDTKDNQNFKSFKDAFAYYNKKLGEGKTFEYNGIKYSTNKGSKEDEERNNRWAKRRTKAITKQIANKYFDKDQNSNSWKAYLQRANRSKVFRNGGAVVINDERRSLKCGGKVRKKAPNGYWNWNTGSWVTDTPTESITVPYKPGVQPSTSSPKNSTTPISTRSSSGNWLSNNANIVGAGLGALSNIGGALLSQSANNYAAKKLAAANTDAANIVANAYRNLQTIDPSSIKREDYSAAHVMPVLQAPVSQANSQIALANRQLQRRLDNAKKYSASSAAAQTRATNAEIDTQDIKNVIYAKDQEQMQKIRQANAQRVSEAALQNAQLDAEANKQYNDAYLNVLQYNNNIKNQRLLGAANALSEGTVNSANAMANATTANSSAWNNAILNSSQGFANTLTSMASRKADLEKVLLGASGDAKSSYYANSGSYSDAKNYYDSLIRQYNLIQNSNNPEDQDNKAYLRRLINTIATNRNFETVQ